MANLQQPIEKTNNGNCSIHPDHLGFEYHANEKGIAWITPEGGLTKREHFAAMAMQGLLTRNQLKISEDGNEMICEYAVKLADDLLKQLEL